MSDATPAPPGWKDRILMGLLGLGIVARIAAVAGSPLLNADGFFYIDTASYWRAGSWEAAYTAWRLHPVYPLLLAGMGTLISSPWVAGVVVSLLGALGAMGAFYALVKDGWGEAAARGALFLYALHPPLAEMESEVMTEGVYHALAFGAAYLLQRGFRTNSWKSFAVAGALLGTAYMTRLEGLILASTGFMVAAAALTRPSLRGAWKGVALAALAAVLVALPFLLSLRASMGRWSWSPRPAADRVADPWDEPLREWEAASWRRLGRGPGSAFNVAYQAQKFYSVVPLVFALLTVVAFRRGSSGGKTGAMLAAWAGLGLAAVGAYHFRSGYPMSVRYVSTATALLLPWAGWGLAQTYARLSAWRHGPAWATALLLVAGAGQAVRIPDFGDPRKVAFREAADWLRENGGRGKTLLSDHGSVPYHAEARILKIPGVWRVLPETVVARKVDLLVLSDRMVSRIPPDRWKEIQQLPAFAELRRFGTAGEQVAVYRVREDR